MKVIDKTRDVLAERKDGSVVRINLSVSEQEDGQGKKFTGLFREAKGGGKEICVISAA